MAASGKGPPRVSGPGDGPSGVGAPEAPSGAPQVERAERVDEVGPAAAAELEAVRPVAAARPSGAADPVAEVAAALRGGAITVAEAVDRLIDDAISRRVGRAVEAGGELEARLRRVLRDYAEADPLIRAKVKRLETRRGDGKDPR